MSFTVYKSSAGSGKTYTLVREYLCLVLPNPSRFKNVLAITFTNKAANEMKERIIGSLKEIAHFKDHPDSKNIRFQLPEIALATGLSNEELSANAKKVLNFILHDYSEFAISTIDSFVHRVIRSFAFDLHLPINFEVEMEEDELRAKIVDTLISKVGSEPELTRILVNFIESKTDDEKGWNIERDLLKTASFLSKEDGSEHIQKLRTLSLADFSEIPGRIQKITGSFELTISQLAEKAVQIIRSKGIPDEAFYQGKKGISVYFENLKNGRWDKLKPNGFITDTIENKKWYGGKADPKDKSDIDEIKIALTEIYHQIENFISENYHHYILLKEIQKNIYPLAVLNEIAHLEAEYKSENELVLISEFNRRIAEVVLNEPVPFIYERMGEKYNHLLLDEFQDTSILQWYNLLPLIENSLATDNFNMVVGDGKQAIYRWRGGDVEQFAGLPKILNRTNDPILIQREQSLIRNYRKENLGKNFRSKREIVEFNNDFFSFISGQLPEQYQANYSDVKQEFNPENTGGYLQFQFFDTNSDSRNFDEFNLEEILLTINHLKTDGYRLADIAILCRNNKNSGFLAQELLKREIPVISSESLQLNNSPAVRLMVAAFKSLLNHEDKMARVEIINYLRYTGLLEGDLHELFRNFGLLKTKDNQPGEAFFGLLKMAGLDFNPDKLLNLPIYDLSEELIRIFGLQDKPTPYLQFFLDAVLNFSKENQPDLSGFVEWWDRKGYRQSIIIPAGSDAIRIMTIHKAKGLEFPVVLYPFANERQRNTKDKLWIAFNDPQFPGLKTAMVNTSSVLLETPYASLYEEETSKSLLDLVNLLYVVMTRPTDRLYVFTQMPPKSKDPSNSTAVFFKKFFAEKKLWEEGLNVYKFGSENKPILQDEDSLKSLQLDQFISNPWQNRILISLQASKNWDFDEKALKRKWGNMIHNILAKTIVTADVPFILNGLLKDGLLSVLDQEEIQTALNQFLSIPAVFKYFEPGLKVKTEPEILLPNGKTFRPDRIIFKENETIVIDFKTGKPEEHHLEQVKGYLSLLKEMGFTQTKGFLLYLNEEIVEVPVI